MKEGKTKGVLFYRHKPGSVTRKETPNFLHHNDDPSDLESPITHSPCALVSSHQKPLSRSRPLQPIRGWPKLMPSNTMHQAGPGPDI